MKLAIAALASLLLLTGTAASAAPDGLIRHYIRSNKDGSAREHIVQFRPGATDVSVYKWVGKCTGAAYVTAQMDPQAWEPVRLTAGRVGQDGGQRAIGDMRLDPASRAVSLSIDMGEDGTKRASATMPAGMPWFLFDYDLGDLNAYLQERKPAADFRFAWGLVWPDGPELFRYLATVQATHRGIERHDGRPARRFDLSVTQGTAGTGTLWTDPKSGALIEAEASLPNHPGMIDYRLVLERTERGGKKAWDRLLKGHYADCPATLN